jgi:diguanylate cyclase (GGDEF)-like protein
LLARVHSSLRTKAYLDLLEHRAHIDGLTELSNRHALQNRLPQEWDACMRRGNPLAIIIIDLDHFKRINDHYGHAAGDEVLRRMAGVLRSSFRETDFIARYGGEEFVVIAPDCDLASAVMLAERLRVAVAELQIEFRTANIKVTTSIGIALGLDPSQAKPVEALDHADQALYRAKGAGRNAVWIWDPQRQAPIALETWQDESGAGPITPVAATHAAAGPIESEPKPQPDPDDPLAILAIG